MLKRLMVVFFLFLILLFSIGISEAKERQGQVTIQVSPNASKDAKRIRLWIPYPVSDEHQRIEDVKVSGNFIKSAVYREPKSGSLYLYAEWNGISGKSSLELSFKAWSEERSVKELNDAGISIPVDVKRYLEPNRWVPTDGKVREIADAISKNKRGILARAKAVYDWVVDNTYRDPKVKGCGLGIVERTLAERGGKCADISSVYIALARASGVPAREVFGLRLGKKKEQNMTGGYHCWAEFYLPGTGWVSVDPADVRKMMLVKNLDLQGAEPYRKYYFGTVDEYRIVLERGGRGITLFPPQEVGPVNYFMYPYAEVDGMALDYLDPRRFSYSVHFKAQSNK